MNKDEKIIELQEKIIKLQEENNRLKDMLHSQNPWVSPFYREYPQYYYWWTNQPTNDPYHLSYTYKTTTTKVND